MKHITMSLIVIALVAGCAADASTELVTEFDRAVAVSALERDEITTTLYDADGGDAFATETYAVSELPRFEDADPDLDAGDMRLRYASGLTYQSHVPDAPDLIREVPYEDIACSDLGDGCAYCASSHAWCVLCFEGGTGDLYCEDW